MHDNRVIGALVEWRAELRLRLLVEHGDHLPKVRDLLEEIEATIADLERLFPEPAPQQQPPMLH
jgi:hypothetical protein